MRTVGTVVRGIRTPIIKEKDNLEKIVVDSLLKASEAEGFKFRDRDVVAITEAVVGISEGNYATVDQIGADVRNKFGVDHIGIVFPTPMSRNRFSLLLKGFARGCKELTILLSYPADEVGNHLFDEDELEKYDLDPYSDILEEESYNKMFGHLVHPFTGINYVDFFKELVEEVEEARDEYNRKRNEIRRLRSMELKELELLYPEVYKLVDEYYNKRENELKDYLKKQEEKIKETII